MHEDFNPTFILNNLLLSFVTFDLNNSCRSKHLRLKVVFKNRIPRRFHFIFSRTDSPFPSPSYLKTITMNVVVVVVVVVVACFYFIAMIIVVVPPLPPKIQPY